MIANGVKKLSPHRKDYSVLHTFGAIAPDPAGLPLDFSVYDGRTIPDQRIYDYRFIPPVRPLPLGCTGETQSFNSGLADGKVYMPDDLYDHTPPGIDGEGRDIRASMQTIIDRGLKTSDGQLGNNRKAYFNCYGTGKIDDYDAARIALWLFQEEKRAVSVGSWWYQEFARTDANGSLPMPSLKTKDAALHNYSITGWRTFRGIEELEVISWQGMRYGRNGVCYMSRPLYNALMRQPWTGAFTATRLGSRNPVPIGTQAVVDHLVYFFLQLFKV